MFTLRKFNKYYSVMSIHYVNWNYHNNLLQTECPQDMLSGDKIWGFLYTSTFRKVLECNKPPIQSIMTAAKIWSQMPKCENECSLISTSCVSLDEVNQMWDEKLCRLLTYVIDNILASAHPNMTNWYIGIKSVYKKLIVHKHKQPHFTVYISTTKGDEVIYIDKIFHLQMKYSIKISSVQQSKTNLSLLKLVVAISTPAWYWTYKKRINLSPV
jgi:hypothetical protein